MIPVVLLFVFNFKIIFSLTTEKIYLSSIERSVDISLRELDKRLVKMLTEPPPSIDKNVQACAQMNVLLYRYIQDYFNYLNGIGDLLLNEDKNAYRLLEEIGVEGPEFLKLEMLRESWHSIGKMYGFHEGEIEEMTTTFGATKFMWQNMKKQLEAHLEKKKKT
uniref:Uncharacterized protein n=1 Tax=Graphocephala atropunctata TaxID=36148 RepID=A0A1B6LYE8_9HEMI